MRITPYGVRGSLAAPGPATARYGGNTSCVRVAGPDGTVLALDAGTGIRSLALELPPGLSRVDVLLTHLHMDHIIGLGFFGPLYNPGMEVHIWGPASATLSLEARLRRYLAPPLFPVLLRDLPCRLELHHTGRGRFSIGAFHVRAARICHPGPTVGYRIETEEGSDTLAGDTARCTMRSLSPAWWAPSTWSRSTTIPGGTTQRSTRRSVPPWPTWTPTSR
jgi:phosphoribosyl 1,2-cyclic phosphodiesterase